jgi:YHS domain-containing protein
VYAVLGTAAQGAYTRHVSKILVVVLALGVAACSQESSQSSQSSQSPQSTQQAKSPGTALPAGITRVTDPSQVCMVNDQYMGKPQIPVEVEGRTYYGCCPMCKDKLDNQASARLAQDPVTGEQVDKASAIMVQDADGKILYFASEATLSRYRG